MTCPIGNCKDSTAWGCKQRARGQEESSQSTVQNISRVLRTRKHGTKHLPHWSNLPKGPVVNTVYSKWTNRDTRATECRALEEREETAPSCRQGLLTASSHGKFLIIWKHLGTYLLPRTCCTLCHAMYHFTVSCPWMSQITL